MPLVVSLLRGINLASHRRVRMDALREVYESLGLDQVHTYLQSGNVVFRSTARNLTALATRIEKGVEQSFGFRADVILRTPEELQGAIERNPFGARRDIEPNRLLVTFLAAEPAPEAIGAIEEMNTGPEKLRLIGRELYIYYTNGMARPKLSFVRVEKALNVRATGRNWNTVTKLLEMCKAFES